MTALWLLLSCVDAGVVDGDVGDGDGGVYVHACDDDDGDEEGDCDYSDEFDSDVDEFGVYMSVVLVGAFLGG